MKRIMAIDYGNKRVGVAISDPLKLVAAPLTTMHNENIDSLISEIDRIAVKNDIETIVVGIPYHEDGNSSQQTETIISFIEILTNSIKTPVVTYNENYSSVEAKNIIKTKHHKNITNNSYKKQRSKGKIDKIAAAIILQNYLNSINE